MLVRVVGPGEKGEGEGGHPAGSGSGSSPPWMRVLALEIFRGLCGDFNLMIKFYERYDARGVVAEGGNSKAGSTIFSDLMTGLSRLATEKPALLGVGSAIMYGSSMSPIVSGSGASGILEGAVEMGIGLAQVAGNAVVTTVGPGLAVANASMKLQCIDQLDKADPPAIPETYIFLLALQALTALSDGFSNYTLAAYSVILSSRPRTPGESNTRSPAALDWQNLDKNDSKVISLLTVKDMAQTSWPALLASLSFFVVTALDDDLFTDVISALQSFTSVCGVLGLELPREAFITSLCKFSVPAPVVAHLASLEANGPTRNTNVLTAGVETLVGLGSTTVSLPVGLSNRNYAALKALISVSQYLAGSLDSIWFAVFETLQNADFVIRINSARNAKRNAILPSSPARPNGTGSTISSPSIEFPEQNIQASITKLFEVSKTLEDDAFKWFVGALCRLNGEMIGIPMATDGSVMEAVVSSTPMESTGSQGLGEQPSRRRASGISTIRTLVGLFSSILNPKLIDTLATGRDFVWII